MKDQKKLLSSFKVSHLLEFFKKYFSPIKSGVYLSKWQGLSLIGLVVLTLMANGLFVFYPERLRGDFLNQSTGRKNLAKALGFRKNLKQEGKKGFYRQRGKKRDGRQKLNLQVWEGPFIEYGLDSIRILKVQQGDQLSLEFRSKQADNSYHFINSVPLKGSYEAFYSYLDNKKNKEGLISLAVFDHDGDGKAEVIAPSFGKFLRPYVNVIGYNQQLKKFYLKSSPSVAAQKSLLPKIHQRF